LLKDTGSGLVRFGGRWYDATTGTWTRQDALDSPPDPANANRYAYAGDDPINNADPAGTLTSCQAVGTVIGVGRAIVGFAGFVGLPVVSGGTAALAFGALAAVGAATVPATAIFGGLTLAGEC
jgi:RHS repeat-associated protein